MKHQFFDDEARISVDEAAAASARIRSLRATVVERTTAGSLETLLGSVNSQDVTTALDRFEAVVMAAPYRETSASVVSTIAIFLPLVLAAINKGATVPKTAPLWWERLSVRMIGAEKAETMLGDLAELFARDLAQRGLEYAQPRYYRGLVSVFVGHFRDLVANLMGRA